MPNTVEVFASADFKILTRPGVRSVQLLSPHNAPAARVTITKVTVEPGASQPRHMHATAEQIWIVEQGTATLLLGEDRSRPISCGDVIRTPAGETHGIHNAGATAFVYIAVTTPPIDFTPSYDGSR